MGCLVEGVACSELTSTEHQFIEFVVLYSKLYQTVLVTLVKILGLMEQFRTSLEVAKFKRWLRSALKV